MKKLLFLTLLASFGLQAGPSEYNDCDLVKIMGSPDDLLTAKYNKNIGKIFEIERSKEFKKERCLKYSNIKTKDKQAFIEAEKKANSKLKAKIAEYEQAIKEEKRLIDLNALYDLAKDFKKEREKTEEISELEDWDLAGETTTNKFGYRY